MAAGDDGPRKARTAGIATYGEAELAAESATASRM
jgi:hypothetical protein